MDSVVEDEVAGQADDTRVVTPSAGAGVTRDRPVVQPVEAAEFAKVFPEEIERAAQGAPLSEGEIVSATDWLLADDEELAAEVEPVTYTIEVQPGKKIEWKLRPLSDEEFAMARRMAMGSKKEQQRNLNSQGIAGLFDERKYQKLIVAVSTVSPDLEKQAEAKGTDPATLLGHRFRYRPGWIAELAGYVNDISGYDSGKIEVVESATGNS